ncbi:MAG: FliA/WhiG family RNA polymerase sigma factor [Chloroflexi bacterium]|nr:FliA/WhiG family RNA polymerase sigma factor [Chloroflexota bacterium]
METASSTQDATAPASPARLDPGLRERLISQHMGLVHHAARKMIAAGNGVLEMEDLVSYGTIGLIEAVDRFDHDLGPSFAGYALHRIRGAMLDAARSFDPLPRSVRHKVKEIGSARNALSLSLGREPLDSEVCESTGIPQREYQETMTVVSRIAIPLESITGDHDAGEGQSEGLILADPADADFTEEIEHRELIDDLGLAISRLPEREKLVVALYFKERLTLDQIASVLEISASRVAQLKGRAIERLRVALGRQWAA